jgi:cytochrome c oxidase assembly protein subunit 11
MVLPSLSSNRALLAQQLLRARAGATPPCGTQLRRALSQGVANESAARSGGASSAGTGTGRSPPPPRSDGYSLAAAMLAVALGTLGLSYASVPLYRIFCQTTGFGGTTKRHTGGDEDDGYDLPEDPASLPGNRPLRVTFNTDVSGNLQWSFKPVQKHVTVLAGQTALAFFEATNHSDEPIIGVATYNVVPNEAGAYFNKIQCFCFDEQRLLPGETVDMPVFFYIDPEFLNDRRMKRLDTMTLSYTFFKSNEIYG